MTAHVTQAVEWIRDEQAILWCELGVAIRTSLDGAWSVGASLVARRIVEAARLVGPTPCEDVPWSYLAGGVYEAVLAAGGVTPDLPDEDRWREMEQQMGAAGTRAVYRAHFARTVAAITDALERRELMDWGE